MFIFFGGGLIREECWWWGVRDEMITVEKTTQNTHTHTHRLPQLTSLAGCAEAELSWTASSRSKTHQQNPSHKLTVTHTNNHAGTHTHTQRGEGLCGRKSKWKYCSLILQSQLTCHTSVTKVSAPFYSLSLSHSRKTHICPQMQKLITNSSVNPPPPHLLHTVYSVVLRGCRDNWWHTYKK